MFKQASVLVAVVAIGCSVESEDSTSADLGLDEETREIVQNLRDAGYPEAEIEVKANGMVFAGGDAEVGLEASREMVGLVTRGGELWEPDDEDFRQYRTTNTVGAAVDTICVNGAAYNGTLSTALNNAIASYTNLNLRFNLVRTNVANGPGCDATITANVVGGGGGSAGFPSGGLPYGTINIGNTVATYGVAVATHVITHELGHTIGFRHSDYYNRSISCGGAASNEGASGVGAVLIPGTPGTAVMNGSVMNSCFNNGSTGVWTNTDLTALNTLYPAGGGGGAPSPSSCVQNATCGGQAPSGCYCDAVCVQYGDCCADGPC